MAGTVISGTEPLKGRRGFLGVESHNEKDSRADTEFMSREAVKWAGYKLDLIELSSEFSYTTLISCVTLGKRLQFSASACLLEK